MGSLFSLVGQWFSFLRLRGTKSSLVDPSAVEAIADFWVGTLSSPNKDNGAEVPAFVFLFQDLATNKVDVQKFHTALKIRFAKHMVKVFSRPELRARRFSVRMDYNPCGEPLQKAMKDAEVEDLAMPMKARMEITPHYIEASCGYRNPMEVIWGTKPADMYGG